MEYEEGWDLCLHSSRERRASKHPKAPAWGCQHQEWKSRISENAWSALLKDVNCRSAPSRQRAGRKEGTGDRQRWTTVICDKLN